MDENTAGVDTTPDRDLTQAFALALEFGQDGIYIFVHEKAAVDFEGTVGPGSGESEAPFPVHGEPCVIPVSGLRRGGDGRGYVGRLQAGHLFKVPFENVALHLKLSGIGDVLPLAAATLTEVGARRLDAVGGGVDYPGDNASFYASPIFMDLDLYGLAGDGEGDGY